ncbi:MAG: ATP-dependent RecD-like DNA helicase [Deltaproteobacteria bacterium]|nr:ATP-dependent RecD-like DNA helicase [Deltaproteobacteria bacterium]
MEPAELSGQIEHVTYADAESGFTIARVKVPGKHDLVTVVGELTSAVPGEVLQMRGRWVHHPKYGEQFRIIESRTETPATVYGIRKYLGSGMIKGIGPVMADRIVERFGKKTLQVIESESARLFEVEGIGKKRIAMIKKSWDDQQEIRDVMIFLQSQGVSPGYAVKIFRAYGRDAVTVVKEDPYRLAEDIFGIGFLTADRIAERLGIPKNAPMRIAAGILYTLQRLAEEGHVYYPYVPLVEKCRQTLSVDPEEVTAGLKRLFLEHKIVIEKTKGDPSEEQRVYPARLHRFETGIAHALRRLADAPRSLSIPDPEEALKIAQRFLSIRLESDQLRAIEAAVHHKVLVITGGPGTGKTTIIRAVLALFAHRGARILLAAPTGRAAKRMTEACGFSARTIHRLLEYSPKLHAFQRNENRLLRCHLLVLDEASMIDTFLMYHLLKAIPESATLILVGDVNQLPSVGPGNVLKDIIDSGRIPTAFLMKIFRQAQGSRIIVNAHRINAGEFPDIITSKETDPSADFFFVERQDPEKALQTILWLAKERIPARFGFDPMEEIQVLSPMHKGVVGAANLNRQLQQELNPRADSVLRAGYAFRLHDKVMQIRNNYDKEVFNGDIGRIVQILKEDQEVIVSYDGRAVVYDFTELDEIVLAYAVSVHKSQGSEYPVVIVPVLTQHYILLQRNLIYTAVTRAQKLLVMVGTRKALAIGIKNDKTQKRYTGLKDRLRGITPSPSPLFES